MPGAHAGTAQQQRHAGTVLEQVGLAEQPVRAQRLAMVAGVDDAGVLQQPQLPGGVDDRADLPVQVRDQRSSRRRSAQRAASSSIALKPMMRRR
jgi:hypothetical protein